MDKRHKPIKVWQWNCRGFIRKRPNLEMLLSTESETPSIIALQEPGLKVKLTGYQTFQSSNNPYTARLVQRNIPAERQQFDSIDIPHDFVVLYPPKRAAFRLYILNVYSSPREHGHSFTQLFALASRAAQQHPLVVLGDFNAPHTAWGYSQSTRKGRLLWELVQSQRLTVESDSSIPTRIGNSAQKDTSPDLSFTRRIDVAKWSCTTHTLGSDHFIIQLDIQFASTLTPRLRQQYLTDWDAFRRACEQTSPPRGQCRYTSGVG